MSVISSQICKTNAMGVITEPPAQEEYNSELDLWSNDGSTCCSCSSENRQPGWMQFISYIWWMIVSTVVFIWTTIVSTISSLYINALKYHFLHLCVVLLVAVYIYDTMFPFKMVPQVRYTIWDQVINTIWKWV